MAINRLRKRIVSPATALGLGIALPFAVGVTPAYAQPQLTITKTHVGDFPRGGQGVYRITVRNTGDEPTSDQGTRMQDVIPEGLTLTGITVVTPTTGLGCVSFIDSNTITCDTGSMAPGASYTVDASVDVASDAPCTVTNSASVLDLGSGSVGDSVSDPTSIPGSDCGDGSGGSILPVNLSGVLPMFNNINTNNNINSPGAANTNKQTFGLNAP